MTAQIEGSKTQAASEGSSTHIFAITALFKYG